MKLHGRRNPIQKSNSKTSNANEHERMINFNSNQKFNSLKLRESITKEKLNYDYQHCCPAQRSPKKKPVKPVSEKFNNIYTVFEISEKKSLERKIQDKPKWR